MNVPSIKRPLEFLILWIGGCLLPWAAAAQTNAVEGELKLGLNEACRIAFERNWDLLAAKSDVDVAQAQQIVAREFPNPVAAFSVSKISASSPHGSSTVLGNRLQQRSYDSVIGLSQLIEIGGKRTSRKAVASSGLKAQEQRFADARRQLDLAVTRAYLGVLTADEEARILGETALSLRREAEVAQFRVKAGDISTNDRVQIEIAADRIQLEAQRALAEGTNSRVQLGTLLGQRLPSGGLVLTDSMQTLWQQMSQAPAFTEAALMARPDVLAALAAVHQADASIRLQKAQRVPDPTVSLLYEHEPPDQPHTVGVGVSFPLPLWNRNRGNITAAKALKDQAQTNADKAAAAAYAEATTALRDFESARARRDDYVNRIVPKSASVRETVTFAYQKGGATLLDLLSAQRNDNEVRLAAAHAAAEVIVARAVLASALNEKLH